MKRVTSLPANALRCPVAGVETRKATQIARLLIVKCAAVRSLVVCGGLEMFFPQRNGRIAARREYFVADSFVFDR